MGMWRIPELGYRNRYESGKFLNQKFHRCKLHEHMKRSLYDAGENAFDAPLFLIEKPDFDATMKLESNQRVKYL